MASVIDDARESDGVMVPSHFHHGLILLLHTAEHMINTGVGLRHLCDWAVFYSRFSDAAFREMFEEPLKYVGLWRFARLLTLVSVRYLRSPARAWAGEAREELLESIMDDVMRSGDFGAKDSERINQAKLMTNGAERTVSGDPLHNLAATFADKASLAWPICGRVKVLLPVGMAYVGMRHIVRVARGERPAIHVKSMLAGAEQRRKVYEEFQLFKQE